MWEKCNGRDRVEEEGGYGGRGPYRGSCGGSEGGRRVREMAIADPSIVERPLWGLVFKRQLKVKGACSNLPEVVCVQSVSSST